jgi:hypothetical protein
MDPRVTANDSDNLIEYTVHQPYRKGAARSKSPPGGFLLLDAFWQPACGGGLPQLRALA